MGSSWMAECAAAELQALEAAYPGRLNLLKLELRSFILEYGSRSDARPVPSGGPSWVVEWAFEELRAPEAEHPNQHGWLKLELIGAFMSDALPCFPFHKPAAAASPPPTSSAATQESSTRKRKKATEEPRDSAVAAGGIERKLRGERRRSAAGSSAESALERAAECLRKIRRVKEVLANGSRLPRRRSPLSAPSTTPAMGAEEQPDRDI